MSRSQLARTPANFPRMKHRAAGRLAKKRGHGKVTPLSQAIDAFTTIQKFVTAGFDAVIDFFGKLAQAFKPEPTQADFALTGPTLPQADLNPYLAIANESASAMSNAYNRASRHEFERITKEQHDG